ncbi:restriction endonuclease subunit S [Aliarcobacter cryaerophilus]|uniref:restriction endonuclease subunit S n=1 Tax=Aliarcobacter cryaerophilus TaxID=28198 RepID=UPI003DA28BF5
MKLNYRPIGNFIRLVDIRNKELKNLELVGVTVNKRFIPSVANIIGSDMTNYKIIKKNQFACSLMQVRRDGKIPVALFDEGEAIISQAYPVFEIVDTNELLPQYLMMWMTRSEFDREACFYAVGGVRGSLEWEDFCAMQLPVPSIEKQKEIFKEYHTITDRIKLNEQLNQKLEDTAQSIYKEWFVNFEFPDENGKPYKSNGGEMEYCDELDREIPKGWNVLSINKFANLKYGKMLDSDKFLAKGYPIFSGYGIRGYYSSYMYEEPQILVLCRGVSGTGEVKLSPPKAYITNLSIVIEIEQEDMFKYFVYYYLKNQNLRQLDSGSAQSQITIDDLNSFTVLCPMKDLQEKFSDLINSLKLNVDARNKSIENLDILKKVLLSKMATIEG